jgi:esterase/lipase superfamily enzyme
MTGVYHHWESPRLGQKFEVKTFGTRGTPLVVFPSSEGRFWDFEDQGMIEVCRPFLEAGKIQIFCLDGRDWETWANTSIGSPDRARRHEQWESAVVNEVIPLVHSLGSGAGSRRVMVTGCSGGAFHAANFMFRHPDLCDTAILLSGVYSTRYFRTDHVDDSDYGDPGVYYNNPLHYLKNLHDEWYLSRLRDSRIIICCGQGAWEEQCLAESRQLAVELAAKGIPHQLEIWGHDVNHDWPWWRIQIVHFLRQLGY